MKKKRHSNEEKRHFYLNGYFSNEKLLKDMEQKYFDDLGIELIPFCKDKEEYEQLNYIFEEWSEIVGNLDKDRTNMYP